jgi:hypothetical protein
LGGGGCGRRVFECDELLVVFVEGAGVGHCG